MSTSLTFVTFHILIAWAVQNFAAQFAGGVPIRSFASVSRQAKHNEAHEQAEEEEEEIVYSRIISGLALEGLEELRPSEPDVRRGW